jgi:hypothetical protein
MADLLGQNIGLNYKGLLNIGGTINTPLDGTLRTISDGMGNNSLFQLSTSQVGILSVIARASGTNADNPFLLAYTVNNTGGTNTVTGFKLNATETAIVGTTHNLLDLQIASTTRFRVNNVGSIFTNNFAISRDISTGADGNVVLSNSGVTNFGLLKLGGTTNLFPALKRNGTGIDFRLADDSAFSGIQTGDITMNGNLVRPSRGRINFYGTDGDITLTNSSETSFGILKLGGLTNLFPSIKRNGAGIDFRLADDSAFCNISANNLILGSATAGSRLTVRGDGTNPIARFENSGGVNSLSINNDGSYHQYGSNGSVGMFITNQNGSQSISGGALNWYSNLSALAGFGFRLVANNILAYTSGTGGLLEIGSLGGTFSASAGSGNFRPLSLAYTINNSGVQTGNATGLFLNATETALNGMSHNLMDLQVGGVSKFKVDRLGQLNTNSNAVINGYVQAGQFYGSTFGKLGNFFIDSASDGVVRITDNATTSFNRLQLGGTTSSFPAIKRNGAAIDFRLADDSGYCDITGRTLFTSSGTEIRNTYIRGNLNTYLTFGSGVGGFNVSSSQVASLASAILQADSTTQGFLPPRMTTTQINAIVSPAEGLVVFNTTISHLCVRQGGAWVRINHSPM